MFFPYVVTFLVTVVLEIHEVLVWEAIELDVSTNLGIHLQSV